uniref:HDC06406 n=1 Tax=Drosophila melanogaster TaxID=7227 RepID=Q6IGF9_DROME|nr:TPA_inf: HDC06406 [Drosophila melanogaster]
MLSRHFALSGIQDHGPGHNGQLLMLPRFLLLTGPAFAGLLPLLTAKRRVGVASALICTPR